MDAPPPPSLPPKPSSHETSRIGTPITSSSPLPGGGGPDVNTATGGRGRTPAGLEFAQPEPIPDPGDQWLPKILQDKS